MQDIENQFEEAKSLLIKGEMDECLEKFCNLLKQITEEYGELNYKCAKYYYGYANALLYKLEANQDVFGVDMPQQAQENEGESESENGALGVSDDDQQMIEKKDADSNQDQQEQISQNQEQAQDEDDNEEDGGMNLVWQNLETSRFICDKYWKEICNDQDVNENHKIEVLSMTAKILKRLGDFLCLGDEFSKAIIEYQRCLEIRQKSDDNSFSRDLAELYFVIGSAVLMEDKSNCEQIAIKSFTKGKKIIENNLARELKQEQSIFAEGYSRDLLKEAFYDSEQVQELKQIIKDIWDKIDDTQLQLDQKEKVMLETNKIPVQNSSFDKPKLQENQTINVQRNIQVQRTIQPQIIRKDLPQSTSQTIDQNSFGEKKLKLE